MISVGEKPLAYEAMDVEWFVGQVNKLREGGLKGTEAIAQVLPEFRVRTKRQTTLPALKQLYYKHRDTAGPASPAWVILAVNKTSGKVEEYADMDVVQAKLGHLAGGYEFFKARKLAVKVLTKLVIQ